jgi:hypothetical protein
MSAIRGNFIHCATSHGLDENGNAIFTNHFVRLDQIKMIEEVPDSIKHSIIYTYKDCCYVVYMNPSDLVDKLNSIFREENLFKEKIGD